MPEAASADTTGPGKDAAPGITPAKAGSAGQLSGSSERPNAAPAVTAAQLSEAERLLRAFFISLARRDDRGNWARRLDRSG